MQPELNLLLINQFSINTKAKLTQVKPSIVNRLKQYTCSVIGHQWQYRNYTNYMKPNGEVYDFTASRTCKRCKQNAYYYSEWKNEAKSNLDFENKFDSYDKI